MISYALETVDQIMDAYAVGQLSAYHRETVGEDVQQFDISNVDRYRQIERQGILRLMVARQDGLPVGFCTCFVTRSNQYAETVAQIDMIFVVPQRRTRMIGLDLISRLIHQLRREGITRFRGMSAEKVNSGPLWRWLGFEPVGTIYECSLPAITN